MPKTPNACHYRSETPTTSKKQSQLPKIPWIQMVLVCNFKLLMNQTSHIRGHRTYGPVGMFALTVNQRHLYSFRESFDKSSVLFHALSVLIRTSTPQSKTFPLWCCCRPWDRTPVFGGKMRRSPIDEEKNTCGASSEEQFVSSAEHI